MILGWSIFGYRNPILLVNFRLSKPEVAQIAKSIANTINEDLKYPLFKDKNKIKKIKPIRGDCRRVAKDLKGKADRIIMGYLRDTIDYLPFALTMLKKKGIIHYHDVYNEENLWYKPIEDIKNLLECFGFDYKILEKKKVKSFAPRIWHIVLDVEVRKK